MMIEVEDRLFSVLTTLPGLERKFLNDSIKEKIVNAKFLTGDVSNEKSRDQLSLRIDIPRFKWRSWVEVRRRRSSESGGKHSTGTDDLPVTRSNVSSRAAAAARQVRPVELYINAQTSRVPAPMRSK